MQHIYRQPPLTAEVYQVLLAIWRERPCVMCGEPGDCKHREPALDIAEWEASFVQPRTQNVRQGAFRAAK